MTVIRDAVIRIRTERSGASGGGFEARAFAAEARAAREAAKEIQGANRERDMAIGSTRRFELETVRSAAIAGRGLLELTRGFALLATSSEAETRKVLENLIKIEAGVGVLRGVAHEGRALTAVIGAEATAFVGLAAAVTAGFVALDYFSESSRRARRETEEFNRITELNRQNRNREAVALREAAMGSSELRNIDLELAGVGTPAERIRSLQELGGQLAKDQEVQSQFEVFRRRRLANIEAGRGPAKMRGATEEKIIDAEQQQVNILRDRIRVQNQILQEELRELEDRKQKIRDSASAFSGVPGIGGIVKGGGDAAIAAIERQKMQIEAAANNVLRDLLNMLRDQQEQVNRARIDMQSLER